ncbi:hypothetical protein L950_0213445 [Sphingobacterium sp. IITKGP-BTPF85]|nr:hypothetical protein L950_0213445 [Sphingobacterium sp. IITKGP-BTPF85]
MATLYIKNMVCDRCIMVVQSELKKLDIQTENVTLGKVALKQELSDDQIKMLNENLLARGFEVIDDKKVKSLRVSKTLLLSWYITKTVKQKITYPIF